MIPDGFYDMVNRRYQSQRRRAKKLGLEPLTKNDIKKVLVDPYKKDFMCCYCDKSLLVKQSYPSKDVASVDHVVSLANRGAHYIDNLCVCCHACNIIKGTLPDNLFLKLINLIKDFKELAKKIDRVEKENKGGDK